jgi:acetyl esterase/lipase
MAPEYPYPYPINDCFDIMKWAKENPSTLGVDPSKVIIGGSSAGGNLTAALALKARDAGLGVQGQIINIPNITHPKLFPKDQYKYESTTEFEVCSVLNTKEMTWFWGTWRHRRC